jgi:pSer/pThr/pTyr-binding forkhead associated (FHA) protein
MAWMVLPNGERRVLKGDAIRIWRDPANDLVLLNDSKVSRSHADLRNRDGQWLIVDLGSSNGTKVNGRRVDHHPLRDGDRIQLGGTTLLFASGEDPNATEADTGKFAGTQNLSEREGQVLALIAQGLTDREIGAALFISASTVRSHLDRIGEKTGLRRRAELTRLAVDMGIVD